MFTLFSSHRYETTTTGERSWHFHMHSTFTRSYLIESTSVSSSLTRKINFSFLRWWCRLAADALVYQGQLRLYLELDSRHSLVVCFFGVLKKTVSQAAQQRARRHDMWNCADIINCLHFLQNHQEKCCLPFGFHLTHSSCSLSWINFPAHLRLFLTFSLRSRPFCAGIMRNFSTISFFTRLQIEMLGGVQNDCDWVEIWAELDHPSTDKDSIEERFNN